MNSPLATLSIISPNKSSRTIDGKTYGIDTITIHCMATNWTSKRCGEYFASADAESSSNYGIGYDGDIAVYVPETHRSWASSNRINDARAVTIEVACDAKHPYAVSDKAYASLIALVTDICERNGIKRLVWSNNKDDRINHLNGCNMTVHRDFANKACPGDYLYSRMGKIAEAVNKKMEDKPMTYNEEYTKAIELGITDGSNPDQPATRKQTAVMIYRAIKIVFKMLGKVEV